MRSSVAVAVLAVGCADQPGEGDASDASGGSLTEQGSPTESDSTSQGGTAASTSTDSVGVTTADPPTSTSGMGESSGGESTGGGPSGPFDPACPPPDVDNLPTWLPEPGSWGTISNNTMWDLNPCDDDPNCSWSANLGQRAVLDVWNGGAFACHEGELGSLVAWGGGHNGYWGNEVYVYDVATQMWERRGEPNPNVQVADPDNGELDDGTPSVMHTYEMLAYHPGSNSLVVLQGQGIHNLASTNGAGHMFSLTDNAWRRTALLSTSGYGSSAYDSEREVIWGASQFTDFFEFDPVGGPDGDGRYGAATTHHSVSINLDTVAAIDPNNDVYVLADLRGDPPRLLVQDLSDPASPMVQVAVEGPMPSQGAGGFEWASSQQKFYWIADGSTELRSLEAPDGDWRTEPWQWETVTPAGGQGPAARGNGVYGGFRWAPAIQSFVLCNDVQDPVYAYRP